MAQLADIENRKAECVEQLSEAEERYEIVSAKLDVKEKEFWSAGGNLSLNRETIKKEKQRISNDVKKIQDEILRLASDAATPLFLCRD